MTNPVRGSTAELGADHEIAEIVRDGSHDFDFLHGRWRVHHRRLLRPLVGSCEWYEFDGYSLERPLWDGRANIEEIDGVLPDGTRLRGLALRLYDSHTRRWTIHWSNAENGTLDPPMTGSFRDGVGTFYGHDLCRGRTVRVRFLWTNPAPDRARWEQAFSANGGATWEANWVMEFTRDDAPPEREAPAQPSLPIVELRRYVLHPGMRDTLIALFEREFIEGQEECGMQVVAQFRDLDDPNVFTWMRAFPDMESRRDALHAFYDGPVWRRFRDEANATMVAWDDVRLLRPMHPASAFLLGDRDVPRDPELVVATIYTLAPSEALGFAGFFRQAMLPHLRSHGIAVLGVFETEPGLNTFPALPVREGEHTFVWFARFASADAHARCVASLEADPRWAADVRPRLDRALACAPEAWRLAPTDRSRVMRVRRVRRE